MFGGDFHPQQNRGYVDDQPAHRRDHKRREQHHEAAPNGPVVRRGPETRRSAGRQPPVGLSHRRGGRRSWSRQEGATPRPRAFRGRVEQLLIHTRHATQCQVENSPTKNAMRQAREDEDGAREHARARDQRHGKPHVQREQHQQKAGQRHQGLRRDGVGQGQCKRRQHIRPIGKRQQAQEPRRSIGIAKSRKANSSTLWPASMKGLPPATG